MERLAKWIPNNKIAIGIGLALQILLLLIAFIGQTEARISLKMEIGGNEIDFTDNRIVILQDKYLSCYDSQGTKLWDKQINLQDGQMCAQNDSIYLADNTGKLLILDEQGDLVREVQTAVPILNLSIQQGKLILQGDQVSTILNTTGDLITVSVSQDKMVLAALGKEKWPVAFSDIGLRGVRLKSTLEIQPEKEEDRTRFTFYDEVIQFMTYLPEGKLLVVSNANAYVMKDQSRLQTIPVSGLKGVTICDQQIFLMANGQLQVYDLDLTLKEALPIDEEFTKIVANDRRILVYGPTAYGIYQPGSVSEKSVEQEINSIKTWDNDFYLIHNGGIESIIL